MPSVLGDSEQASRPACPRRQSYSSHIKKRRYELTPFYSILLDHQTSTLRKVRQLSAALAAKASGTRDDRLLSHQRARAMPVPFIARL
jgi:hypothetical protein